MTWVDLPDGTGFTPANLPYGVVAAEAGEPYVAVRIGDHVLPVAEAVPEHAAPLFARPSLDAFLDAGPDAWRATSEQIAAHLDDPRRARPLPSVHEVDVRLPFTVADYVDFYSSLEHATNLGRILRPGSPPLPANWRHLPVGYHGRAGSVAVSGADVRRPCGLVEDGGYVRRRPSAQLDFELEVGFVVGRANESGRPIAPDEADRHVFGAVLVNDWSARDIQAFEYQPLGPFLGKSFLTSISAWVVPLDALQPYLVESPVQDPPPDPCLHASRPWALDVELSVELCGTTIARTNLRHLYWTFAQQLAHLTSNGAVARRGDLLATGTVSDPDGRGSLIELTERGAHPIALADGTSRRWLEDGDRVVLRGHAGHGDGRVGFGEVAGTVVPPGGGGR